MFKELKELADSVTLNLTIKSEGPNLRVFIMPDHKTCSHPALATPLVLVNTPEELDKGFAKALQEYKKDRSDLATDLSESVTSAKETMKAVADDAGKKGKQPSVEKSTTKTGEEMSMSGQVQSAKGRRSKKSQSLDLFTAEGE